MKPPPFRLSALLDQREAEKDRAARDLAAASERVERARRTIADIDRRAARVRGAIAAGAAGSAPHALRDEYAMLEHLHALRLRATQELAAAESDCERRREQSIAAARAWKLVNALRARATARRAAYERQLDEQDASESNMALAARQAEPG